MRRRPAVALHLHMTGIAQIVAVGHDEHALTCVIGGGGRRRPGVAVTCQTVNAIGVIQGRVRRQPLRGRDRDVDGVIEGSIIDMAAARCAGVVDVGAGPGRGRLAECCRAAIGGRYMAGPARQFEMMKPDAAVGTIRIVGKSAMCGTLLQLCTGRQAGKRCSALPQAHDDHGVGGDCRGG